MRKQQLFKIFSGTSNELKAIADSVNAYLEANPEWHLASHQTTIESVADPTGYPWVIITAILEQPYEHGPTTMTRL